MKLVILTKMYTQLQLVSKATIKVIMLMIITIVGVCKTAKGQAIMTWDYTAGNNAVTNLLGGTATLSSNGITNVTTGCTGNGYGGSAWVSGDYIQILASTTRYQNTTMTLNLRSSATGPAASSYTNTSCALSAIILPVTVTKFYHEYVGKAIMLKWDVMEEKNTNYYLIEKIFDGIRYDNMSTIYSANKSEHTYFNVDESPIIGYNYYRLSSVDYDGYRHYHQTLIVNNTSNVSEDLIVSHADEFVSVFPKELSEDMQLQVINSSGKAIQVFNMSDFSNGSIRLSRDKFSSVIYLLKLNQQNKITVEKLIIY